MRILLCFAILTCSPMASATCQPDRQVLFFANGMFNNERGARNSLLKLARETAKKSNTPFSYALAYNTDEIFLLQLYEVYQQKAQDTALSFWRWLEKMPALETNRTSNKIIKFFKNPSLHQKDLKIQVATYEKLLRDKSTKIVTVAHSQGNFFTNFAFHRLNSERTKMISVATPAQSVYENGPYFTFKSDRAIAYIPLALKPNREKSNPGLVDHEFVNDYLADFSIREEILEEIVRGWESPFRESPSSLDPNIGYFNSDVAPLLTWFNKALIQKQEMKRDDCIVSLALFAVYGFHGISCEERNLTQVRQTLKDCERDLFINTDGGGTTSCTFNQGDTALNPFDDFYPPERFSFYEMYPVCKQAFEQFPETKKADLLSAIQKLDSFK